MGLPHSVFSVVMLLFLVYAHDVLICVYITVTKT